MIEHLIIKLGILFGFCAFPTLNKRPSSKLWLPLYLINCLINYLFDKSLVQNNKVKYPIRFLPGIFKINFVYDFLICPFLSVWYCQSTYDSKFKGMIGKLFLFATPQVIYEILLERKTLLLRFKGNWKWFYSAFLVFLVKLLSRGLLELFKIIYKKPTVSS